MSKFTIFKPHLKTFAAVVWFAFTFSLVGWWWIYFILKLNPDNTTVEQLRSSHRMFAWEGSILLAAILIGGIALILFTYRDQQRHQRLRFFSLHSVMILKPLFLDLDYKLRFWTKNFLKPLQF